MGITTRTDRAAWGRTIAAAAIALTALGACTSGDDAGSSSADEELADDAAIDAADGRAISATGDAAIDPADSGDATALAEAQVASAAGEAVPEQADAEAPAGSGASTDGSLSALPTLDELGRSIAVEAGITLGTADVRSTLERTLDIIRANNGIVAGADVQIGSEREDGSIDGGGRVTAEVPPTDLERLIGALDGRAGTLLGRTQTSDDVTEQLVDLDTRIGVERTTIQQFEQLLRAATEFGDIVEIQRVISEHTTTLERLLAAQRNLEQRVELSTLTIDIRFVPPSGPDAAEDEQPEQDRPGIADRFHSGWNAFATALFAVATVLAVGAPFFALAGIAAAIVWATARIRRRNVATPADHPARGDARAERAPDEPGQLVGTSPRE